MAVSVDTVTPQWRDPEFAYRLRQVQAWRAKAPDRPLVLAFGSSRTQMGLSPAAMEFADRPGSPVVYNFGYRGAHPLGVWLHFTRVLDSGVRPDAVLIQLAPVELMIGSAAEQQLSLWTPRMTREDIRLLAPHTQDDAVFRRAWVRSRLNPWTTYRQAVLSDLAPEWHTVVQRKDLEWERIDQYGFSGHPFPWVPDERRRERQVQLRQEQAYAFESFAPSPVVEGVYRDMLARCRGQGIAVAFFWAPASPAYRSWYTPSTLAAIEAYDRRFAATFGAPAFPALEHLEEEDFADGYHLLVVGAAKYSRWLAENHLRRWLAECGMGGAP
jgi:hypothetical protein